MAKKSTAKLRTQTNVATKVGLVLMTASAAAAAFGFASLGMAAVRRPPLAIATASTTPSSDIVVSGALNVPVATYNFTAGKEDMLISMLELDHCLALRDADGDCADAREALPTSTPVDMYTISYQDSSGATITRTDIAGVQETRFTGLGFSVPARTTRTLTVYANMKSIDDVNVFSGDRFQVNLNASMTGLLSASSSSGVVLSAGSGGLKNSMGNAMVIRDTQPTLSLSPSSPSGATAPGMVETLRFDVAADSNADVELNRVLFTIIASENASPWAHCGSGLDASSKFSLVNARTGAVVRTTWRFYDLNNYSCTSSTDTLMFAEALISETVRAGSPETYKLLIDTTSASATADDMISVSIPEYGDVSHRGLEALTWQDGTARGTSINAMYIPGLPVDGNILTF